MLAPQGLNMQGNLQPSQGHQVGQHPMQWHTWQSDQDVNDRKTIMNEIYKLFAFRQQQSQKGDQWHNKLPEFVKRLEEELYRSAKSKAEYQDLSTLQNRLQGAAGQFKGVPQDSGRQEGQAARPPTANSPGNGVPGQGRQGPPFQRGPSGYGQGSDSVNLMNRAPGGLASDHNPVASGSAGLVGTSSGMMGGNRPANYMGSQPLPNGVGVSGMRLGSQGEAGYAGVPSAGILNEPPNFNNGLISMGSVPERGLMNRPDGGNPVMSNGMPVMLRGSRQEFPATTFMPQPTGANSQLLINGMAPAQLANGQINGGSSALLSQYPSARIPSAGMIPNGMISTGNPGIGMQQMIPSGPHISPGMQVPNGEGDPVPPDRLPTMSPFSYKGAMMGNGRTQIPGQLGNPSTSGNLPSLGIQGARGMPGMPGELGSDLAQQRQVQHAQHNAQQQQAAERKQYVAKQQRWLLFLRHCAKCQAPDGQCQYGNSCQVAKALWRHILTCSNAECTYPRCVTSRDLLKHHQKCTNDQCPVCTPVKQYVQKQRQAMTAAQQEIERQRSTLESARSSLMQQQQQQQQQHAFAAQHQQRQHQVAAAASQQAQLAAQAARASQPGMAGPYSQPGHRHPAAYPHGPDPSGMMANGMYTLAGEPSAKRVKREDTSQQLQLQHHQQLHLKQHQLQQQQQHQLLHPSESLSQEQKEKIIKLQKNQGTSLVEVMTDREICLHLQSLTLGAPPQAVPKGGVTEESCMARPQLPDGSPNTNICCACKMTKLVWEPPSLYCGSCSQKIRRNQLFYMTQTKSDMKGYWCNACITDCKVDEVELDGTKIRKADLEKKKNTDEVEEGWVQCDLCGYWVHQICGLFNKGRNTSEVLYSCPHCLLEGMKPGGWRQRVDARPQALLEAKDLPHCDLSQFLEGYVNQVISEEQRARAHREQKPLDQVPTATGLTIRVINNVVKQTEVKPRFLELFENEGYPRTLPYRQKVILMTQKIDGVDVCLYCLYLQEYGDDCGGPNRKWVYLSYLDSVKYFRPELSVQTPQGEMALRSMVYHAVLQGYMQYAKSHGYCAMFIWACPPLQGDDYILYVHPQRQRVPRSDRLREWYHTALRKSKKDGVVTHLSNLVDTFFEGGRDHRCERVSASCMPYFEGDYWPGEVETQIGFLTEEVRKESKKGGGNKGRSKSTKGKRYGAGVGSLDQRVMEILGNAITAMREDFIVAHLQEPCSACRKYISNEKRWFHPDPPAKVARNDRTFEGISLDTPGQSSRQVTTLSRFQLCNACYEKEHELVAAGCRSKVLPTGITLNQLQGQMMPEIPNTHDNGNPEIPSEIFDTRQAFLSLCQGNHYQFDTYRRARHSSMMVLYHLHNPAEPAFATTCNNCTAEIDVGEGFRCSVCADFDLCRACRDQGVHGHHPMQPHDRKKGFNETQQRLSEQEQAERKKQLEKTMALLVHASSCQNTSCPSTNCNKVKALFAHAIGCPRSITGGCQLCRRMWLLLQMHAKGCTNNDCPVPRCRELRVVRRRQAIRQEEQRRMAYMQHIQAQKEAARKEAKKKAQEAAG